MEIGTGRGFRNRMDYGIMNARHNPEGQVPPEARAFIDDCHCRTMRGKDIVSQ